MVYIFREDLQLKISFNIYNWLFLATLLFFGLSFVHISFGLLGLICAITPFLLAYKTNSKLWCKSYCPRASLFTKLFASISLNKKAPSWLYSKQTKRFVLNFFCINLVMISMSTTMVALDRIPPMDYVRFLMAFPIPIELPQLLQINLPDALIHLSYRIFSVMFTSTVIGLTMGFLFRPRSWCGICPVQTLTTTMITQNMKN